MSKSEAIQLKNVTFVKTLHLGIGVGSVVDFLAASDTVQIVLDNSKLFVTLHIKSHRGDRSIVVPIFQVLQYELDE